MASFMAMLRKGHLEYLYNIFAFLRIRHNAELILDPSEPGVDLDQFKKEKWSTTPFIFCTVPHLHFFNFKLPEVFYVSSTH